MSNERNTTLATLLAEFGFTHEQLADEVNRVAAERLGEPANCTARHVRRWVSGEVRWPWKKYLAPLQEIFGRSAEALGFVPRGTSSCIPALPPRSTPKKEPPVHRRNFITAVLASVVGLEAIPTAGRLSSGDVERIRHVDLTLQQQDQALGGGALQAVAGDALARVRHALNKGSYGERVGRKLHAAAGHLAVTAGWFAREAGHHREATARYREALQDALLARDTSLQVRVWSSLTTTAWTLHRNQEAVHIGLDPL